MLPFDGHIDNLHLEQGHFTLDTQVQAAVEILDSYSDYASLISLELISTKDTCHKFLLKTLSMKISEIIQEKIMFTCIGYLEITTNG